jgi:methylmalonyl-CoA mutase N-terminal domain/subunit
LGGVTQAIEKGFIQQEIQNSAYQYQKDIEEGKRIVVGVNKFKINEGSPKGLLKVNPEVGRKQIEELKKLKEERDNYKVKENLKLLEKAARTDANLMPLILDCVKSYATLGEICDVLRSVFGEYKEFVKL